VQAAFRTWNKKGSLQSRNDLDLAEAEASDLPFSGSLNTAKECRQRFVPNKPKCRLLLHCLNRLKNQGKRFSGSLTDDKPNPPPVFRQNPKAACTPGCPFLPTHTETS